MAGDYAWPRHYVASLEELKLHGVESAQIIAYGYAFLNAAIITALGHDARVQPLGESLALEALAEGEANEATARLVDAPDCPARRRELLAKITRHMAHAEQVRHVLLAGAS